MPSLHEKPEEGSWFNCSFCGKYNQFFSGRKQCLLRNLDFICIECVAILEEINKKIDWTKDV